MFYDIFEDIAIYSKKFIVDRKKFDNGIMMTMLKNQSQEEMDISIKSEDEKIPTLLNAGQITNFIYKVTGITAEQAQEINTINTSSKIKDRMKVIKEAGGSLQYVGISHQGFKRNLIMVDSSMPEIIGNMLLYYYEEDVKECDKLVKLAGQRAAWIW